jgi:hypothetical protein
MYRLEMRIVADDDQVTHKLAGIAVSSLSREDLAAAPLHPRIASGLIALTHAVEEVLRGKHPAAPPPEATDMTQAMITQLIGRLQAGQLPHAAVLKWQKENEEFILLRLSSP